MSDFRQIVPNSLINATNKAYQFVIAWRAQTGAVRMWYFSHTDGESSEKFENYVIESTENIRGVPSMDRETVEAFSVSLDADNFEYVKSIMKSNRVYILNEDFSKTPISIASATITRANKLKEFEIKIKFSYKENFILNI